MRQQALEFCARRNGTITYRQESENVNESLRTVSFIALRTTVLTTVKLDAQQSPRKAIQYEVASLAHCDHRFDRRFY